MPKNFVSVPQLLNRLSKANLAEDLDKDKLSQIASRCKQDYDIDELSRQEWMDRSKEALELAMQACEVKNEPWPNAANVKFPTLTIAALQFHARAYPSIIRGNQVVKGQITGFDEDGSKADRALRIGKFMSWQCLEDMDGWEEDVDKLLLCLPILGCMFKKTAYDSNTRKNRSELIFPQNLCINYNAKSLLTVPRMTYLFTLYPQQIIERQMQGLYTRDELPMGGDVDLEKEQDMLEQHCLIDLDDDGYKEPYIATIHKDSDTLLRLVPNYAVDTIYVKMGDEFITVYDLQEKGEKDFTNYQLAKIEPVDYFTKFSFFPSPDGGIYDFGFGQILYPLIESVNTAINQMLDAGTKQNYGGGFMAKDFMGKRGEQTFKLGEFKEIENLTGSSIRDSIYEFQHSGPSAVTMSLLQLLLQSLKDITTVQDISVGNSTTEETATTTLTKVDQGQKLFTAIYKRLYRSLKAEYKKLFRLNRFHLKDQTYFSVLDKVDTAYKEDFKGDGTDVQPVADPQIASLPLKITKAQVLRQASSEKPALYNQLEVEKRFLEAIEEPNIEGILVRPEDMQPPPDPKMIEVQAKVEQIAAQVKMMETEQMEKFANIMKTLSEAEATAATVDNEQARIELDQFTAQFEAIKLALETIQNQTTSTTGQSAKSSPQERPQTIQPPTMGAMPVGANPLAIPGQEMETPEPRASGGPIEPGKPYLVGEQGPEVIVPQQSGTVIPNEWTPTKLSPQEETQFQDWLKETPWYKEFGMKYGEYPNPDDPNYDYRGAWKGGVGPNNRNAYDSMYHWPDALPNGQMLKSPEHPTVWMEYFMRETGKDPQSLGINTKEEAEKYLTTIRSKAK